MENRRSIKLSLALLKAVSEIYLGNLVNRHVKVYIGTRLR